MTYVWMGDVTLKCHDPGISIMDEPLEITLQVAIDVTRKLKLTFIFKS